MKTKMTEQTIEYKLDVATTKRSGDFACPCCRIKISPDDHSENVYSLGDIKLNKSALEEIVLRCNRCNSIIRLTGFLEIQKITELEEAGAKMEEISSPCYVTHV